MTDDECRTHTKNHIMGLSLGIGLLIDGLEKNIKPDVLTDTQNAQLHELFSKLFDVAGTLAVISFQIETGSQGTDQCELN